MLNVDTYDAAKMCVLLFQVQVNGLITMDYPTPVSAPYAFPGAPGSNAIAVYLADVDAVCRTHLVGSVFIKYSTGALS